MNKIYIVTDLGTGDGGKGGIVHALAGKVGARVVIKVGGGQGSHGVRTSAGQSFAFSHLGCATFEGVATHLSDRFVIKPNDLINEVDSLSGDHGIDAANLLTVDERALCATPIHRLASKLEELLRKGRRRGTVGSGVGNAVADSWRWPELAIRAGDMAAPDLREKLEALRQRKLVELAEQIEAVDAFLPEDRPEADEMVQKLRYPSYAEWCAERFAECARLVRVVPASYLAEGILARDGCAVVESSHGVLTDRLCGFHPHTSKLRTLPEFTHAMLRDAGFEGKIVQLGICRAYGIRHGAGPFVTEDPSMLESLLPGSSKTANRYQGHVRVGALDAVALRYAIEVCGGPQAFDGLAITWFDQIQATGRWPVCDAYEGADDRELLSSPSRIVVRRGEGDEQLAYQRRLGEALNACRPIVKDLPPSSGNEPARYCADVVSSHLGAPVRLVSLGPTERDKEFI